MEQLPIAPDDVISMHAIAPDVIGLRILFVNVFAVGDPKGWTLVDAGLHGSAGRIRSWAEDDVAATPPNAIVLTHAHFDHIGRSKSSRKNGTCPCSRTTTSYRT